MGYAGALDGVCVLRDCSARSAKSAADEMQVMHADVYSQAPARTVMERIEQLHDAAGEDWREKYRQSLAEWSRRNEFQMDEYDMSSTPVRERIEAWGNKDMVLVLDDADSGDQETAVDGAEYIVVAGHSVSSETTAANLGHDQRPTIMYDCHCDDGVPRWVAAVLMTVRAVRCGLAQNAAN